VADAPSRETIRENDIARITVRSGAPLYWDPYGQERTLGSALLVDESTHETVGGLMFRDAG
jgi:sulfate adenylyltransferase subunit 1 (EFTu-like GTPase family)